MAAKTPEEIFALKSNWKADPHWDIEETEGFEAHRAELLEFRHAMEKRWQDERNARILARMDEFRAGGISYDMGLVDTIITLEDRLASLTKELAELKQARAA